MELTTPCRRKESNLLISDHQTHRATTPPPANVEVVVVVAVVVEEAVGGEYLVPAKVASQMMVEVAVAVNLLSIFTNS